MSIIDIFFLISINVLLVLWRNYNAHQFFKTKTPSLPTLPNPSIFHGHLLNVMTDKSVEYFDKLHAKYGSTFGGYMCEKPWVATKDLDLIKLIQLDQPNKHLIRGQFGIPVKEFNHSIFQINDDEWRQIRRIVSPTMT